ncbi:CocE/NonD family hydrolase C-terminal non-catalytic domain-containing protein [Nocardia arizonensis]|uniref:CocE/NonD family hydrolase C-terminal non-catalytic domain-containing protein n=1 Tax=Nocardia arizonensis TaxID=1141647 RepID=UPI0006CFCC59|nr:CocE/NonD family hydrolase C-terminal non-catalytic domain-containing protein [Nocardia arizonensis]
MAQYDSTIGITAEQVARISTGGMWDEQGAVRPEAVHFATNLVRALETRSGKGLVPDTVDELVGRALNVAIPSFPRIETAEGYRLSAHLLRQTTARPRPLIVIPAGWTPVGWPLFEYAYLTLAAKGYHVLAYTPRGIGWTRLPETNLPWFGTSEGTVDVAGPRDREDGSRVLTHAIDAVAPSGIAFMGESYGSGISQLVAAHDPRVDVVVALSTWGNLATSLYANGTRHLAAVEGLIGLTGGTRAEKFDADAEEILRKFFEGRDMDDVVAWGTERAPETYLDGPDVRAIPTFFSNTWHEGLFAVNQVIPTFEKLRGPKRLNMWIGDHAVPEGPGLIAPPLPGAEPNLPLREAYAWLDHHLLDTDNGVDAWPQVSNQIMFTYVTEPDVVTGEHTIIEPARREERATWSEVCLEFEEFVLTEEQGDGDGVLTADTVSGWQRRFTVGKEPAIVAMDKIMTTGQQEWSGNPKIYPTTEFDRSQVLIWSTPPLSAPESGDTARRIRGIPRLRLTIASTEPTATVVAYLLDVAPTGAGRIITHEPVTLPVDEPTTFEWELQAAAYDMPDGHRLMLVLDGADPLYSTANRVDTTITITAPPGIPSRLQLPLG